MCLNLSIFSYIHLEKSAIPQQNLPFFLMDVCCYVTVIAWGERRAMGMIGWTPVGSRWWRIGRVNGRMVELERSWTERRTRGSECSYQKSGYIVVRGGYLSRKRGRARALREGRRGPKYT